MKTTTMALALLTICLVAAPSPAAPPKDLDELRVELETLTEAISAQMKLLGIYEEMGKEADAATTRTQVASLLDRQRALLDRIDRELGRTPPRPAPAPAPAGAAPKTAPAPDRPFSAGAPEGAPKSAEAAVARGLAWLAAAQDPNGFWDCDVHGGFTLYDVGVTGLALLAFLENGETHKEGHYREVLTAGLRWLKQVQDPEGCFGPRTSNHFTYQHAIATLAMCRAYELTDSPLFKQSAQAGIDFVLKAQNPYLGWRYGVQPGDNDTSVTGWMVAALDAGRKAGLRVDQRGFDGARAWVDKVTEPEFGRVGYTARGTGPARPNDQLFKFPSDKSESLTAEGIMIRLAAGEQPGRNEMVRKGTDLVLKCLPVWNRKDGSIDMYYWYWGTQAMKAVGGDAWPRWRTRMLHAVLSSQETAADSAGSWPPVGVWSREGGRVLSTALMTLVATTL